MKPGPGSSLLVRRARERRRVRGWLPGRREAAARLLAGVFCAAAVCCGEAAEVQLAELADLSLEQLANIEVTSVTGRSERVSDAPASIYVITNDDIRRAGVRTLPEALRLAPNLQVARTSASTYAISARGFNNTIGNKLLVLVDGRTIYTPLFSGVFWDQQDVMLEDVERIEVISGPGATLWGANAVNGVINVITRAAGDTQGTLLTAGIGNRDEGAGFRYGGKLGDSGHFRVYGKTSEIQNTQRANGTSVADGWQMGQAGFRADWRSGSDGFTVQGDTYSGKSEYTTLLPGLVIPPVNVSGANLLARWNRKFSDGSDIRLQAYVDHTNRDDPLFYRPKSDIYDIDFKHGIPLGDHRVLWGGGYRQGKDDVEPGILVTTFVPPSSRLDWLNVFIQDEVALSRTVDLTAGIKFERNDYTGWESLPSLRLTWKPEDDSLLWGAVSRAVRAPSRLDRDVRFPAFPPFLVFGGTDFQSEVAKVYEVGYRAQPSRTVTYSITAFRHDWERLRSGEQQSPPFVVLGNKIEGFVNGIEAWGSYQAAPSWRLSGGFTTLHEHLQREPGSTDPVGANNVTLANDPDYQWLLRSSHNLTDRHDLDIMMRRIASLPQESVPAYTATDLRLGWRAAREVELSVTLQNMFDREHAEFGAPAARPEYGRSIFLKVLWRTL